VPFVRRNLGLDNPRTGKAYSISELVALWTQKPMEEAQAAQQNNRQAQQAAKQRAKATGAHAPAESSGFLSREQALAEIGATL